MQMQVGFRQRPEIAHSQDVSSPDSRPPNVITFLPGITRLCRAMGTTGRYRGVMAIGSAKQQNPRVPKNAWAVSVTDLPVLHTVLFPDPTDRTARPALCGTPATPVKIVAGLVDICDHCRDQLRILHEAARRELADAR